MSDTPIYPSDWSQGGILDLVDRNDPNAIKPGPFGSSLKKDCYVEQGYKVYGQEQVIANSVEIGDYYVSKRKYAELYSFRIKPNDILISLVGTVGKVLIVPTQHTAGVINPRLLKISPCASLADPQFAAYILQSETIKEQLGALSHGLTMEVLNGKTLRRLRFGIPPLPQQRKIARILATVDNLIEKTEALIAKYQAIKQGMMHDLFTRGVDEHGHLRPPYEEAPELYKQSELGSIPKEWEVKGLTELASYQTGQPFPSAEYCNEGIRLLRPGNLPVGEYVQWDDAHTTFLPHKWESIAKDFLVFNDEIVMNLTAQSLEDQFLGRVCVTPAGTHCLLNQRLARFRSKKCHLPFLFWALKGSYFRCHIDRLTQGTKVQHIYNSNLNSAKLGVPKSDQEQKKCASVMLALTRKVVTEQTHLEKLKTQKTGLMQDLLTGNVRVKVDEAEEVAAHA